MKTHTLEGERLLSQVGGILGNVGRIVRSCHEDWDGTGYPDGLEARRSRSSHASSGLAMPSAQ